LRSFVYKKLVRGETSEKFVICGEVVGLAVAILSRCGIILPKACVCAPWPWGRGRDEKREGRAAGKICNLLAVER
jgi:hypothetical protein